MKKTLITLLALGSFVTAEDYTPTVVGTATGTASGGYGAIDFTLGSFGVSGATLDLDQISMTLFGTWYSKDSLTTGFGIGIYEKTGESSWILRGKSEWYSAETNVDRLGTRNVTIAVSGDVLLSAGKTYTLAFHSGKAFFDGTATGENATNAIVDVYTRSTMYGATGTPSNSDGLAAVGIQSVNEGTTGIVFYQTDNTQATSITPKITLTGTVPEPTTATLSLLALAGLAARRRRR